MVADHPGHDWYRKALAAQASQDWRKFRMLYLENQLWSRHTNGHVDGPKRVCHDIEMFAEKRPEPPPFVRRLRRPWSADIIQRDGL